MLDAVVSRPGVGVVIALWAACLLPERSQELAPRPSEPLAERFQEVIDAPRAEYVAKRDAFIALPGAADFVAVTSMLGETAVERGIAEALLLRIRVPGFVDAIENYPCNKWRPGAKLDFECERETIEVYVRAPVLAFEHVVKSEHWCCKQPFVEIVARSGRDRYERIEALLAYSGAARELVHIDPKPAVDRLLDEGERGSQWLDEIVSSLAVTRTSDPRAIELARKAFRDGHRYTAATALAELGDHDFAEEILAAVDESYSSHVYLAAVERLVGRAELTRWIEALAKSSSSSDRVLAANALGHETRNELARAQTLLQLARDPNDDVRARALWSIVVARNSHLAFDEPQLRKLVSASVRASSPEVRRIALILDRHLAH